MNTDLLGDRNPAMKLWELLAMWRVTPGGQSVFEQRGGRANFWNSSVEAVRWCDLTLDEVVAQGEYDPPIVEDMRSVLEQCRDAIFSIVYVMNATPAEAREHISEASLLHLRLFARSWQPVSLEPNARGDVLDLVQRLRALVVGSSDLIPEVKDYIVRLTMNIETTLTASKIWGDVNLREQSMQLASAVQVFIVDNEAVDDHLKDEAKPLLIRFWGRLTTSFWVDVVPKMIGAGIGVGQHAIEQGMDPSKGH